MTKWGKQHIIPAFFKCLCVIQHKNLRVIAVQVVLTGAIAVLLRVVLGEKSGAAAALGGSVGVFSALAYVARSSMIRGRTPRDWLQAQYAGERFKFLVTVILFSAVFALYRSLKVPEFFLTYIATLLAYFAALLMD